MTDDKSGRALAGIRRRPPPFRILELRAKELLTPRMARITLGGDDLAGFTIDEPAASVRLLLPSPGAEDLVIPSWNGNEFLLEGGQRPVIRTFTPMRFDPGASELGLDVVLHDGGAASAWVRAAALGDQAAISGPGRGYTVDLAAESFVLGGDETAMPAISQLITRLPETASVLVLIEIVDAAAEIELPPHPAMRASWLVLPPEDPPGAALVRGLGDGEVPAGAKVWVAGEAAAMHQIRRHLFDDRSLPRSDVTVRGYWKHGR